MRLSPILFITLAASAALAGCAHPLPPAEALPPNPYGYLKPASVCVVPTPTLPAVGAVQVPMRMNNDGGFCKFDVAQAAGGPFASFIVTKVPLHGSPLLYNYDGMSRITYTPTGGYLGPDSMTVQMVAGPGAPRVTLEIAITVSNAPVAPARS